MSDVHTDEDLWLVKLADGRVRSMTVDDMDSALERGELDATTEVQAPDTDTWTTLGVVAGLDEAGDAAGDPSDPEADATTPLVAAAAKAAFDHMEAEAASAGSVDEAPLSAAPRVAYDEDDTPASNNAPSLMPTVASVAPPSSLAAASLSTPPSSLALDLDDDARSDRDTPMVTGAWTFDDVARGWRDTLAGVESLARSAGMRSPRYHHFLREAYALMMVDVMEAMAERPDA